MPCFSLLPCALVVFVWCGCTQETSNFVSPRCAKENSNFVPLEHLSCAKNSMLWFIFCILVIYVVLLMGAPSWLGCCCVTWTFLVNLKSFYTQACLGNIKFHSISAPSRYDHGKNVMLWTFLCIMVIHVSFFPKVPLCIDCFHTVLSCLENLKFHSTWGVPKKPQIIYDLRKPKKTQISFRRGNHVHVAMQNLLLYEILCACWSFMLPCYWVFPCASIVVSWCGHT